jgi:hypothetical protein
MGERPKSCRVALPGTLHGVPCSQPLHLHHPSLDKQLHPRDMARIIEARNATTLAPGPPSHPLAPAPAGRHSPSIHPVLVCRPPWDSPHSPGSHGPSDRSPMSARSSAPQPLAGCTRQKAACPSSRRRMRSAQSRIPASRDHHVAPSATNSRFAVASQMPDVPPSPAPLCLVACLPYLNPRLPQPAARRPGRWMSE